MHVGDRAPDFTLYTSEEKPFTLSAEIHDRNVVLLFFPAAFSSICTNELSMVSNSIDEFGDSLVVGISTDSPMTLAAFREVNRLNIPLVSDHDADVAAAYNVKYDRDFTSMGLDRIAKRSAFVIDRNGIIRHMQIMPNAGQIPDMDLIRKALEEV